MHKTLLTILFWAAQPTLSPHAFAMTCGDTLASPHLALAEALGFAIDPSAQAHFNTLALQYLSKEGTTMSFVERCVESDLCEPLTRNTDISPPQVAQSFPQMEMDLKIAKQPPKDWLLDHTRRDFYFRPHPRGHEKKLVVIGRAEPTAQPLTRESAKAAAQARLAEIMQEKGVVRRVYVHLPDPNALNFLFIAVVEQK